MIDEEVAKIWQSVGDEQFRAGRHNEAAEILRDLIQSARFVDFLTLPAYE
jgi:malate synthase